MGSAILGAHGHKPLAVGDEVILRHVDKNTPDREAVVTKVGTKIFTVDAKDGKGCWGAGKYRIETRRRDDAYGHWVAYLPSDIADEEEANRILAELAGLRVEFRGGTRLNVRQLKAVLAAVKEFDDE